jgi:hypothetical protein
MKGCIDLELSDVLREPKYERGAADALGQTPLHPELSYRRVYFCAIFPGFFLLL